LKILFRAVSIFLIFIFILTGCSPNVKNTSSPIISQADSCIPTHLTTPQPTEIATPKLAEPATTTPQDTTSTNKSIIMALDAAENDGTYLGYVAVTDGISMYYRDDCSDGDNAYTILKKYDIETKTSKAIINTKGKGYILDLLIFKNTLYYVLADGVLPEGHSCLYKYDGKSSVLLNDVDGLLYMDGALLYYFSEYDANDGAAHYNIVSYNLDDSAKLSISTTTDIDSYDCSDGINKIEYYSDDEYTYFVITNLLTDKTESCKVMKSITQIINAFIYNGNLYVTDTDNDSQKSYIYDIDFLNNRILSERTILGIVSASTFYNDKWYFYSSKDIQDTNKDGMISVYDLTTNKTSKVVNCTENSDPLDAIYLANGCNYLWIYSCAEMGEYTLIKKVKISD
jgi:hypothetical protein